MTDKTWIAQPKENRNTREKPWEVKRENADRASRDFRTREKAWQWARNKAEEVGTHPKPAKAKLKLRRDGTFSKNISYPRKVTVNDRRM